MDVWIAALVNRAGRGTIDSFSETLCAIEFLVVAWLAVFAFVWWRDRPQRAQVLAAGAVATALNFLVNELVLKHLLLAWIPMRVRPWMAHPDEIVPIGHLFEDSSFPSSHTASTAAIAVVLGAHYPRSRVPVGLFVLSMAFARVHNGMHYPTDVLCGALFGTLYGLAGLVIVRRIFAQLAPQPAAPAEAVAVAAEPESGEPPASDDPRG